MLHTVFVIIFVQYKLYHGVRLVVRISRNREESYSDRTHTITTTTTTMVNSGRNLHMHTQHFKRLFERTFEYSDFFRDHHATTTAYWRRKERLYSNCGLELGLEIGSSSSNPSQLSTSAYKELQSFKTRASELQNPEVRKSRTL